MASFLTDPVEWMPVARLKLGVDSIELPDAILSNGILIDLAEKRVKDLLSGWATHFAANPASVKMAAICFLASNFTSHCETTIMALEYEGTYRSERQKIDWQQKKIDLIGEGLGFLHDLDGSIELYPDPTAISSPATPLYESS